MCLVGRRKFAQIFSPLSGDQPEDRKREAGGESEAPVERAGISEKHFHGACRFVSLPRMTKCKISKGCRQLHTFERYQK